MNKILVLHGCNLNLLGRRETGFYGELSLDECNELITLAAEKLDVEISIHQSNNLETIINLIQTAKSRQFEGLVLNPAGFGYQSISLRDAIICCDIPVIEVHLSNVFKREKFRHNSIITAVCVGQICGLKHYGYIYGIDALVQIIKNG